jgi:2-polyprenyl-3-methyl-5-hydroxy-6-metoxy-1,4-benzoquinol methylase
MRNVADHALLQMLTRADLSRSVYLPDEQVIAASGALGQSVTPLALAIHQGRESLPVRVNPIAGSIERNSAWLATRGFKDDEIARIKEFEERTYRRLGIRKMPWNSIEEAHREMEGHLDPTDLMHGMGSFYQSCEELLIEGQRPTRLRFEAYGLEALLTPNDHVLDIGCNKGFFSLEVAKYVRHVDGFDISERFINIANAAKKRLGVGNCNFEISDFSGIGPMRLYDVVLSFAVHHWIGMPMRQYADRLKRLVKQGGHVLLESQDLATHDANWDQRLAEFMSAGFEEVGHGNLCDDGYLVREFVVLRNIAQSDAEKNITPEPTGSYPQGSDTKLTTIPYGAAS